MDPTDPTSYHTASNMSFVIPSGAFGFNGVITWGKGYVRTICLSYQAINPIEVGKLVPAIVGGNNA